MNSQVMKLQAENRKTKKKKSLSRINKSNGKRKRAQNKY